MVTFKIMLQLHSRPVHVPCHTESGLQNVLDLMDQTKLTQASSALVQCMFRVKHRPQN